ncbi:MAG: LuxR family transcriptional regulator [Robiginitomaculum sp.]|nr:MAG: LuxR family transcriptional regulator [Robiginitomaculum sp.]
MLIDSHANLHAKSYAQDLSEVLARSRDKGVQVMVTICCRMHEYARALAVADMDPDIWCTIGVHPHHAGDDPHIPPSMLADLATHPKVIGIGETGLDYHYGYSSRDDQLANLHSHAEAARQTGLPLVLHTREADNDMMHFLEAENAGEDFAFILHSYTSGEALAKMAAKRGGYFSVNGIASFRNAGSVRGVIADIMPMDRILLETDCPFLAPVPKRGRRNEPAYLPYIADSLAAIKSITPVQVAEQTTQNFFRLFARAAPSNRQGHP